MRERETSGRCRWFAPSGHAVRLSIRVRPGTSRTRVGGDQSGALVVAVTAPAVDGRATEAALSALAAALGVRRREVTLVSGATVRTKVVDVDAAVPDEVLARRVKELLR